MLTLTYRQDVPLESFDWAACSRDLKRFFDRIKKSHVPDMEHFHAPELHESGFPHFHVIVYSSSGFNTFKSFAGHKGGWLVDNSINDMFHDAWTHGDIVDVSPAMNPESALGYVMKYLFKTTSVSRIQKAIYGSACKHPDSIDVPASDWAAVRSQWDNIAKPYFAGSLKYHHALLLDCINAVRSNSPLLLYQQLYILNQGLPFTVPLNVPDCLHEICDHKCSTVNRRLLFLNQKLSHVLDKMAYWTDVVDRAFSMRDYSTGDEIDVKEVLNRAKIALGDLPPADKSRPVFPVKWRSYNKSRGFPLYQFASAYRIVDRKPAVDPAAQKVLVPVPRPKRAMRRPDLDAHAKPARGGF